MNLRARIKKLENNIKPDKIPHRIIQKYSVLVYKKELNPEEAKEKAINEISHNCNNISTEKARAYMEESTLIFLPDNGRNSNES